MQKIILAIGILICSTTAQAYDLSHSVYAGISIGSSLLSYKSNVNNVRQQQSIKFKRLETNFGLTIGRNDGQIGGAIDWLFLNINTYLGTNLAIKFTESALIPQLVYNFYTYGSLTYKTFFGIGLIHSNLEFATTPIAPTSNIIIFNNSDLLGKIGLGLQYACTNYLSLNASLNYLQPIKHLYLRNLIYANLSINLHF